MELSTESTCVWCDESFAPKNRNGIAARFCRKQCSVAWHNDQRLKGASMLKKKAEKKLQNRMPPSVRKPQRLIDFDGIPPAEQAELLANMALEVGVSDGPTVTAARYAGKAIAICRERGLPFKSRRECRGIIRAATDPVHRAKLEAMYDVMKTEECFN